MNNLVEYNKIPKCDNIFIQHSPINNKIGIKISENQSVVKMFEDYVNFYLKDYKHKDVVLHLGTKRYLKNATI